MNNRNPTGGDLRNRSRPDGCGIVALGPTVKCFVDGRQYRNSGGRLALRGWHSRLQLREAGWHNVLVRKGNPYEGCPWTFVKRRPCRQMISRGGRSRSQRPRGFFLVVNVCRIWTAHLLLHHPADGLAIVVVLISKMVGRQRPSVCLP
ncbi:uncharacterized protein HMPREF1120_00683 [Exophiala dermatitidis NIH/UT8656]|uniref:Uncharacterized protein n=1 Tax=Exophiala dermatitidis (strain ATCC 34100 / CBS 525.76 / NIH/UT8656) TaxID=858893 RepID=H6BK17_EXODN|nr:uncharacterized protein HMPREF1120_00683 [Exophiala dermatitidis NIH/UT8656]EHY52471.1 hypothetical protein HMPREF1120_00683 [Exophiala dermatitidis NIH/UT8656]